MKKFIKPKTEKEILKTHPITSKNEGRFIKVTEISNNVFVVEAIDECGRAISKQGSDADNLLKQIEDELCGF